MEVAPIVALCSELLFLAVFLKLQPYKVSDFPIFRIGKVHYGISHEEDTMIFGGLKCEGNHLKEQQGILVESRVMQKNGLKALFCMTQHSTKIAKGQVSLPIQTTKTEP